ncbi:MAG TPA: polysaccharide deacetylase family protein [Candidatus Acidoferrales bacterium]|nr:polysaccharide deacetylase family protein [Candidatus Acidoferrales bacterium]
MWITAVLGLLIFGALAGEKLDRTHPPPLPAIIEPTADAHMLLSSALDARVSRLLHDRGPLDRSHNAKVVALTFDDGPYPVATPLLLDLLQDLHVPATFFLIGNDAKLFPEITARIERDGNEVANHTLSHPARFDQLDAAGVQYQLEAGAEVLERYVHDPAIRTMMRPPHGRFTEKTARAVQRAGYSMILWTEDPGDWRTVPPGELARYVELHATAPDIVLMHSGSMATIAMLPQVIARFRKAGYQFMTVGALLQHVPTTQLLHPYRHSI